MEQIDIRKPAVAGQFYPSSPESLKKQIASFVDIKADKMNAFACMLPHAGYMYSGRVACRTVSRINIKDRIILLGPNHTGMGAAFSIMTQGTWQTPLGEVSIDSDLASRILKNSRYLEADSLAHAYEHSLEVQLPIFQYFRPDFKIVPVILLSDELEVLEKIGQEIGDAIKESHLSESVLVVASSDMTHYEAQSIAEKKDKEAIDGILALDAQRLVESVRQFNISMCGVAPVLVMLTIAKILGAQSATLISYQTSLEATGDRESVVGYAGIIINR